MPRRLRSILCALAPALALAASTTKARPSVASTRAWRAPTPARVRLAWAHQHVVDCWTLETPGSPASTDKWTWVPADSCEPQLPTIAPADWCRIHDGARVLFIGDSLSGENFNGAVALARAHGEPVAANSTNAIDCGERMNERPHAPGCKAAVVCGGRAVVGYVRNDHLTPVRARSWDPGRNVLLHPMDATLVAWRPSIVVLNRGAHYTPNRTYRAGLVAALAHVARLAPGARVILRSTPTGHPNCLSYTAPLRAPLAPSALAKRHHWTDFPRQNGIMRAVAREQGVPFVDYAMPTALRPDGHKGGSDCLHYITGLRGPQYTWLRLLAAAVALDAAPPSHSGTPAPAPPAAAASGPP